MSVEKLDVLFVNPGAAAQVYQSLSKNLAAKEPPVWAGLMATLVRKHGASVEILDADALGLTPEETAKRAQERNPRLIVIVVYGHQPSASTQTMPAAGLVARAVKKEIPDSKILMVGGHIAALPERTLLEEACDFTCDGEGPYTILALLDALRSGHAEDLQKVPGLWYQDHGKIRSTASAPLIADLDHEMPAPAWDLLPMDQYRAHNWHCFGDLKREPYAAIYTTLGCPYHCSFCCIQTPFRERGEKTENTKTAPSYRFWNPETVVREIGHLVKHYGVRNIKIADEMFVLNSRHVQGICERLIERDYGLNLWAYARVDSVRDEMPEMLKRAGVNWLAFGIESASARVRDNVHKGFSQKLITETLKKVRDAGIHVIANFIFGLPEDDRDSMQATLDLALELNCEFANFYCTMAYPGSALYERALEEKWPLPEHWSGYSQHSFETLPLPTKHLSAAEVLQFRDHSFQVYFQSPRYLAMIEKTFGAHSVTHIREMAGHKLKRKILPRPVADGRG